MCPFFSVGTNLSGRPHNPLRQSFAAFPCPHIGCRAGGHCALAYSAPLCLCVLLLAHPPTRSLRCLSSAILPAFEVCARRVTASPAHQIIESYLCRLQRRWCSLRRCGHRAGPCTPACGLLQMTPLPESQAPGQVDPLLLVCHTQQDGLYGPLTAICPLPLSFVRVS